MSSSILCGTANCWRMTQRTLSSGSTIAASLGKPPTSSRTRASYRKLLTTPTFKPKLRSVPRKSDSTSISLRCSSLRLFSSIRCSWATRVFTCTGLNRPTRIICAIPRASLRSVLLICCAVSKAFMCRVSTQITGSSAVINPLTSHCDSGPASIPIRPKDTPSEVRTAMISAGSVGIFRSKTTLPASSITHTDVAFTDTSRPAKWTILSLLPRGSRSADLKSTIVRERGRALIIDACRGRRDTPSVGSVKGPSTVFVGADKMRRFRTFPLSPLDGLTPKRTKWNLLKAVERPFDRHAEKILAPGLVSSRRNVRVVLNRVHIAKVTLEAVLVANPGCSDRLVHEIDCSNRRGYSIGRGELQLHLARHVDQGAFERLVPDFPQRLIQIGPPSAERGFRLADCRLNSDAVSQRRCQIRRRLSRGELQQIVDSGPCDAQRRRRQHRYRGPDGEFVQRSVVRTARFLVRSQQRRMARWHENVAHYHVVAARSAHAQGAPVVNDEGVARRAHRQ